ncbi:SAMC2 [Symbiodinium pilosum]|uniref:SAMC2 protein n=1 Tax=Symbiodinium pilosum TaxID=2952 RepID=A0A812N196_SYMPI|nr:SAMC2 [Symbiodinium pilosum]
MEDARPMGLDDIASVLPAAGPFRWADDADAPDHFLKEMMHLIQPGFREQLVPLLESRFPGASHPCAEDVARHCPRHKTDAPLHCLGLHAQHVSAACVEEVQHAVPFVCSEEIHRFCSHRHDQGVLGCLEEHGVHLGSRCADAVVAARHTLASLEWSHKRAAAAVSGDHHHHKVTDQAGNQHQPHQAQPHHHSPHGHPDDSKHCPPGWDGPKAAACCIRRWSAHCGLTCSVSDCSAAAGWEFRWADFRTHPYICCPKAARRHAEYLGGQQICPEGWKVEEHGHGHCCRKPWTWDCGEHCAHAQCQHNIALAWHPVDDKTEEYKCCPEMPAGIKVDGSFENVQESVSHGDSALLELDSMGSSWISRPFDLSGVTPSVAAVAAVGVLAVGLMLFACIGSQGASSRRSREHKDH